MCDNETKSCIAAFCIIGFFLGLLIFLAIYISNDQQQNACNSACDAKALPSDKNRDVEPNCSTCAACVEEDYVLIEDVGINCNFTITEF